MAYTPTVWATGDIITAEKLNKAEQGIADASEYVVPMTYDGETFTYTLGTSFNELKEHRSMPIVIHSESSGEQGGTTYWGFERWVLLNLSSGESENLSSYTACFAVLYAGVPEASIQIITFTASDPDADMTHTDEA